MTMEAPARQRLVEQHISYVRALATQVKKQLAPSIDVDDLVGYGAKGLAEAADRYDQRQGTTFSTFAYHRIRGAIYDGLRQMGYLPRHEYARVKAAERATEYLGNLADRDAGAHTAGSPPAARPTVEDDLRSLYEAMQGVVTCFVTSLEGVAGGDETLVDQDRNPEERLALHQLGDRVRTAMAALPEKERHFIEKHYFEDKTLLEAGAELGLSKSWASRLHARAIDLLRKQLEEG